MKNWVAVTESGSVYTLDDGFLNINSKRSGEFVFRPWFIKSVPHPFEGEKYELTWETLGELESVEVPVVGEHIYASSRDEWRLSTVVESVKVMN